MSNDSFDAFRKKLKKRRVQDGEEPAEAATPASRPLGTPGAGEGLPPKRPDSAGSDDGPSALEKMRAARARLNALKDKAGPVAGSLGKPATDDEPATDEPAADKPTDGGDEKKRPSAADLFRAQRKAVADKAGGPGASKLKGTGGKKPGSKPSPRTTGRAGGGARMGRGSRDPSQAKSGTGPGDDFENFRRAKEGASMDDAKKRAFEEGVEVEGLDRSRLSEDRASLVPGAELDIVRNELVHRFSDEENIGDADPMAAAINGERPEAYETHHSKRLTDEELGEVEKPAGFETHRAKRVSAEDLDIEAPERLTSHRHKRVKGDPLDEDGEEGKAVEGFKRYEF